MDVHTKVIMCLGLNRGFQSVCGKWSLEIINLLLQNTGTLDKFEMHAEGFSLIQYFPFLFSIIIFHLLFGYPKANFGPLSMGSLNNLVLITPFWYLFNPKVTGGPHNKVGSQSPIKHLVAFELGSFQFWM